MPNGFLTLSHVENEAILIECDGGKVIEIRRRGRNRVSIKAPEEFIIARSLTMLANMRTQRAAVRSAEAKKVALATIEERHRE